MDVGLLLMRSVVGAIFIGHGSQKLFGKFGGHGIEGTGRWFAQLGYPHGRAMAVLAGFAELTSGCLLLLGFLTPFAAAGIIGVMTSAIVAIHRAKGMWNQNGGMEYPLVMSAVAAGLAFAGPGRYSIDGGFALELAGTAWGLSTILLGLITASIVGMSRHHPEVAHAQEHERRTYRAA